MIKCLSSHKVVIIFAQKRIELFRLDQLTKDPLFRFILVSFSSPPKEVVPFFDEVHILESNDQLNAIIKKELNSGIKTENITLICPDEMNLLEAGRLREKWNLKGPYEKDILKFRNKILMKTLLSKQEIKVPKFLSLTPKTTYRDCSYLGFPFIIKPILGASSTQTGIIASEEDWDQWIQHHKNEIEDYEAEEFIKGTLYHCDYYIKNKEIIFSAAFEYLYPCLDYTQQKLLASIPLNQKSRKSKDLQKFGKEILTILDAYDGPYHLECFNHNNRWYFLEIAARPPGGFIVEATEKNFGVNVYRWMVEEAIAQSQTVISTSLYHAWAYIPRKEGKVQSLHSPSLESRWKINWLIQENEILSNTVGSVISPPAAIIWLYHKNLSVIKQDLIALAKTFPYTVEPESFSLLPSAT